MFTFYPLIEEKILYNRIVKKRKESKMAVLTLNSAEYKKFPAVLKNYASHLQVIAGKSPKTICEYLMDLRTFFRYYIMVNNGDDLSPDEFEKIELKPNETILKFDNNQSCF